MRPHIAEVAADVIGTLVLSKPWHHLKFDPLMASNQKKSVEPLDNRPVLSNMGFPELLTGFHCNSIIMR